MYLGVYTGLINDGGSVWIGPIILLYYSMGKTFKASVDWLGMVENPNQDVNPSVNAEMAQGGQLRKFLGLFDEGAEIKLSVGADSSHNCGPGLKKCGDTEGPVTLQRYTGLNYNPGNKNVGMDLDLGTQFSFGPYDTRSGAPVLQMGLSGSGSINPKVFKNPEVENAFNYGVDAYGKLGYKKRSLSSSAKRTNNPGFEAGVYGNYDLLNKNINDVGVYGGYGGFNANLGYNPLTKGINAGIGYKFQTGGQSKLNSEEVKKEQSFTITPQLLYKQAYIESRLEPTANNSGGYKGLGQIGDPLISDYLKANKIDKIDPFDPKQNHDVQSWSMNELYNSSFINKPGSTDEVKLAKALAAYNYGRGNMLKFLTNQKEKGVDIYKSTDWLSDLPQETREYIDMIMYNGKTEGRPNVQENFMKTTTDKFYEPIRIIYGYKQGGSLPKAQNGEETNWDKFENSKFGKFIDARGAKKMYDDIVPGRIMPHFGYGKDQTKDFALDAAAVFNPIPDFIHAGTKLDEGKYEDAAMYAGFGLLPFSAGPLVKGTKKAFNYLKNTNPLGKNARIAKELSETLDAAKLRNTASKVDKKIIPFEKTNSEKLHKISGKDIKESLDNEAFVNQAKIFNSPDKLPLTRVLDSKGLTIKDGKLFSKTGDQFFNPNYTQSRNTTHWSYGHIGDPGHASWSSKSTAIINDFDNLKKSGHAMDLDPTDTYFYTKGDFEIPSNSLILTRDKKLYNKIKKESNIINIKLFENTPNDEFEAIVNSYSTKGPGKYNYQKDLFNKYIHKNWEQGMDVAQYKPARYFRNKGIRDHFGGGSSKMHSVDPTFNIEKIKGLGYGKNHGLYSEIETWPGMRDFGKGIGSLDAMLEFPKPMQIFEMDKFLRLYKNKPEALKIQKQLAEINGFKSYKEFKKSVDMTNFKKYGGSLPKAQEGEGTKGQLMFDENFYKNINNTQQSDRTGNNSSYELKNKELEKKATFELTLDKDLNSKMSDEDFRVKYGTNRHTMRMKYDTQYREKVEKNAIETSKSNGTIKSELQNNLDKMGYNPNSQWMVGASNQQYGTPEQKANTAAFHNNVIGAVVPIPGLEALKLTNALKLPGLIDDAVLPVISKAFSAGSKVFKRQGPLKKLDDLGNINLSTPINKSDNIITETINTKDLVTNKAPDPHQYLRDGFIPLKEYMDPNSPHYNAKILKIIEDKQKYLLSPEYQRLHMERTGQSPEMTNAIRSMYLNELNDALLKITSQGKLDDAYGIYYKNTLAPHNLSASAPAWKKDGVGHIGLVNDGPDVNANMYDIFEHESGHLTSPTQKDDMLSEIYESMNPHPPDTPEYDEFMDFNVGAKWRNYPRMNVKYNPGESLWERLTSGNYFKNTKNLNKTKIHNQKITDYLNGFAEQQTRNLGFKNLLIKNGWDPNSPLTKEIIDKSFTFNKGKIDFSNIRTDIKEILENLNTGAQSIKPGSQKWYDEIISKIPETYQKGGDLLKAQKGEETNGVKYGTSEYADAYYNLGDGKGGNLLYPSGDPTVAGMKYLPEVKINTFSDGINYPYFDYLTKEEKSLFRNEGPIGSSLRAKALGYGINGNQTYMDSVDDFVLTASGIIPTLTALQIPQSLLTESLAMAKGKDYNISDAFGGFTGGKLRYPSNVIGFEDKPGWDIGGSANTVMDILADPTNWLGVGLINKFSKANKLKKLDNVGNINLSTYEPNLEAMAVRLDELNDDLIKHLKNTGSKAEKDAALEIWSEKSLDEIKEMSRMLDKMPKSKLSSKIREKLKDYGSNSVHGGSQIKKTDLEVHINPKTGEIEQFHSLNKGKVTQQDLDENLPWYLSNWGGAGSHNESSALWRKTNKLPYKKDIFGNAYDINTKVISYGPWKNQKGGETSEGRSLPKAQTKKYGGQNNFGLDLKTKEYVNMKTGKEIKSDDIYSTDRYSKSAKKYKRTLVN